MLIGNGDANWELASPSNAPYMCNADGTLAQRLPTDLPAQSGAARSGAQVPVFPEEDRTPPCTSEVAASADLSHFVFSSNTTSFSEPPEPAGLTKAPGSAYDDDIAAGTVKLISLQRTAKTSPRTPSSPKLLLRPTTLAAE